MRYLIVGFGNIGHKRKSILGKKCIATVDPDPEQLADYPTVYKVPLNLFNAVILSTPQKDKLSLVEYFLKKGKHVLVEKPLIISEEQAEKIDSICKKNNNIWYTSYNHRFEPNIIKIQNIIKKGHLGSFYHGRFEYSFGNIQERIGSWRESDYGVLEEIAPHIIDFILLFFNYTPKDFKTISALKAESKIFDNWNYMTSDGKILVQNSSITWKNVFSIDLYFKNGSINLRGLRKWGGSELIIRRRVLPSGVPKEKIFVDKGPDITWEKDIIAFEKRVQEKENSMIEDFNISQCLAQIVLSIKPHEKFYKEILNNA